MGFYGNITNTSKTQFQFDRIYPNRKTMDAEVETDEVFVGRYVLIDYNEIYSPSGDESLENSAYEENYHIDLNEYKNGKGYDSTAWQKVFIEGKEKYVMIAELNSVVPTLDIAVDAPSEIPLMPHFDADSTNVYYKIHLQPSWGFRIKEAENEQLSDEQKDGKKLNIYYNKAGFDKLTPNKDLSTENEINLTTAKSGNEYNVDHDSHNKEQQDDIQELSIKLPAIGNMVSEVWDLVYGEDRLGTSEDSLVGLRNSTLAARDNALEAAQEVQDAIDETNAVIALTKQYINGPEDEELGIPEGGMKQLIVDTNTAKAQTNQASVNASDAAKEAHDAAAATVTATTNAVEATNRAISAAARAESAASMASGEFDDYLTSNGYINTSNAETNLKDILDPIRSDITNNSDKIAINTADINTIQNTELPELSQSIEDLKNNIGDGKFVKITGDTMTGSLGLGDKLILSDSTYLYGEKLPDEGDEGQIYFQIADENDQDLILMIQQLQNQVIRLTERVAFLESKE